MQKLAILLPAICLLLGTHASRAEASDPLSKNGFDLSDSSIPAKEIQQGGPPRDGIAALDAPETLSAELARWRDSDLVIGVSLGAETRAYPVAILNWHELVNDTLAGRPILVSYCPLCGTALVFDRQAGKKVRTFGVSGLLYQSDLLLYDRETESLWSQILSTAVSGPLKGARLELLRSSLTRWGIWKEREMPAIVMARGERGVMFRPRNRIWPALGLT